jgi:hypothetical protein
MAATHAPHRRALAVGTERLYRNKDHGGSSAAEARTKNTKDHDEHEAHQD